jgi:hypothetical protein
VASRRIGAANTRRVAGASRIATSAGNGGKDGWAGD